jgi:hypothetical protein
MIFSYGNLLMINKRDKDSSGKEAESERSKVATGRVVPPKPDPLAAPTALQPSCSSLDNDLLPG